VPLQEHSVEPRAQKPCAVPIPCRAAVVKGCRVAHLIIGSPAPKDRAQALVLDGAGIASEPPGVSHARTAPKGKPSAEMRSTDRPFWQSGRRGHRRSRRRSPQTLSPVHQLFRTGKATGQGLHAQIQLDAGGDQSPCCLKQSRIEAPAWLELAAAC